MVERRKWNGAVYGQLENEAKGNGEWAEVKEERGIKGEVQGFDG
jgi:hypothetical protein